MGLLDDLEKEAERQREEEARAQAERERREQVWEQTLQPGLLALEAYLKQLTEKLAFLKRKIRMGYPLHGYGEVVAQVEPNFVVRAETGRGSYEVVMEYVAHVISEDCPAIQADSVARVKTLLSILQQHGLGGINDARKNPNGDVVAARFQARGKIPIVLSAHGSIDTGIARISFTNLEGFGQSTRNFTPEQLNSQLFDALGRFITREETHFAQEAVADDVRKSLQMKLQRDQLRRDWEGKLSRQLAEDEAKVIESLDPATKPSWLLGRLRLLSVRLFGR